jgi:uncharacterized protein YxjI
MNLSQTKILQVKQTFEGLEFIGIETRNKYRVLNQEGFQIGFIAEKSDGVMGSLFRMFMGHWRKFDIEFFDKNKVLAFKAHHPFRFIFQALKITDNEGCFLGRIEQRFSLFSKKFDIVNPKGEMLMQMSSPLFKFWSFSLFRSGEEIAKIKKKFNGILTEAFSDKDTFEIEFYNDDLSENEKKVILAASIFIDLIYFEKKAR